MARFVVLPQYLAHHVADDLLYLLPQAAHVTLQPVEPAFQVIEPLVVPLEPGLDD